MIASCACATRTRSQKSRTQRVVSRKPSALVRARFAGASGSASASAFACILARALTRTPIFKSVVGMRLSVLSAHAQCNCDRLHLEHVKRSTVFSVSSVSLAKTL